MDANEVDMSLVIPSAGGDVPAKVHDDIAAWGQRTKGRIVGIVEMTPHADHGAYEEEATRCVRELGFVALKLHTVADAINPFSRDADFVFQLGVKLGVPVIVHTGTGVPWALPSLCILPARKYPDLKIVLAHYGMSVFAMEAFVAATVCPNIYIETSFAKPGDLRMAIGELGPHRVMMGADLADNLGIELFKYRSLGLAQDDLDYCLWRTAADVFALHDWIASLRDRAVEGVVS